jgi:DNA-binding transcriptional LysR family regulator
LSSGQADITVLNDIHTDEVPGGFAVTVVYEDSLAMIIRAEDYESPDIDLLEKYPVATQASTSAYRRYVEQWSRSAGIAVDVAFEHSSFDGILAYVLQGKCIGMVSGYIARNSPMSGQIRVLNLPDFYLKRKVVAAHAIRPDPLAADFLEFFHDFYLSPPEGRAVEAPELVDSKIS